MKRWTFALAAICVGCAADDDLPTVSAVDVEAALIEVIRLGADTPPHGVTRDRDSGERVVFHRGDGLLVERGENRWETIGFVDPRVPTLTDVASLGGGLFAMPGRDGGYLFDASTGMATEHYCFAPSVDFPRDLPPSIPPVQTFELSRAAAYDPVTDRIFAAPQTLDDEGRAYRSELAWFDRRTGNEIAFRDLPDPQLFVGAMAVLRVDEDGDAVLILGVGSELWHVDEGAWNPRPWIDLAPVGVRAITGLDLSEGQLDVLDGVGRRVFVLDGALLEGG